MIKTFAALLLFGLPAAAHDIRYEENVKQLIQARDGQIVEIIQYPDEGETVDVTVFCLDGKVAFQSRNDDSLIYTRNPDESWTATWSDGKTFETKDPPSTFSFACHTH